MRVGRATAAATLVAGAATMLTFSAAPANAAVCEPALNGTYTAFSDGQWAQTRDSYHDETSVTSTWNITSMCTDYQDCTGRVTTTSGWSADALCSGGMWTVKRQLDNWETCEDGTTAPGQQTYLFNTDLTDPVNFAGWDKTIGPSGACGKNQWLTITMPFRLTPT